MKNYFSLLWEKPQNQCVGLVNEYNEDKLSVLGFSDFVRSASFPSLDSIPKSSLTTAISYLSTDQKTLQARQELFAELLANANLYKRLQGFMPYLEELHVSMKEKSGKGGVGKQLYSLRDIRLYLECVAIIHEGLSQETPSSRPLRLLKEALERVYTSQPYKDLSNSFGKVSDRIRDIRSITVGINLDAQLNTLEAGIVSVNEQPFVSGHPIDKFLRAKWRNDAFTCRGPLVPITKGLTQSETLSLNNAFTSAFNKIILEATGNWKSAVTSYIRSEGGFLSVLYCEWSWIQAVLETLMRLRDAGKPLCAPAFSDSKTSFSKLYHPCAVMAVQGSESFERKEEAFAKVLFYLGIPIPAENAHISSEQPLS